MHNNNNRNNINNNHSSSNNNSSSSNNNNSSSNNNKHPVEHAHMHAVRAVRRSTLQAVRGSFLHQRAGLPVRRAEDGFSFTHQGSRLASISITLYHSLNMVRCVRC